MITSEELKEIFKDLEEQGWEPQLCDTSVPYFENAVPCGNPTDVGDLLCGMELYPKDFFDHENEFMATVRGDSMKDADIEDGDRVKVRATRSFQDGDVLLLIIDGEYTLKSFCRDEDGRPWLLPQNPAYQAFPLNEHQNVRVRGVVTEVIKQKPRINYRTCMKEISKAKQAGMEVKTIGPEQISRAIREVASTITVARQWYAVFRAMADMGAVGDEDFDTFCTKVRAEVPEHKNLPTRVEMQRMAIMSFRKPVSLWDSENAPVQGKRFNDYLKTAKQTKRLLGNK